MRFASACLLFIAACSTGPVADAGADVAHDASSTLREPRLGPVPALPDSREDPPTEAKMALGTAIFFDTRLSGSGHSSCDSCHGHLTSFQDNLPRPVPDRAFPADRPLLSRNTPSFNNLVYAPIFRWDGEYTDLIEVSVFPFAEANMNLGGDVPMAQLALQQRFTEHAPGYVRAFQQAYGVDIRAMAPAAVWRLAGRAIATFLGRAVSRDAAFDRWNAGDDTAMNPAAVRGFEIFRTRGRCLACHNGPLFTDFAFHNISTSPPRADGTRADEGRYLVTHREEDRGAFLTPTLRGVYDTAPYFHDGASPGLRSVLSHFAGPAASQDPNHDSIFASPITLTDDDVDDLIEFMNALRGAPVARFDPPAMFP